MEIGAVIREHDRVRPVDVVPEHLRANRLPSDVPNLQRNLNITFKLKSLQEKVQSYCLLVLSLESIVCEAMANGSLADGAIAKENDLNEQKMSMNISNRAKYINRSGSGADTTLY